tara:strand:+ start:624 stop:1910 length:1287 start_codon:yes stop_codon:yes gene_type:complete
VTLEKIEMFEAFGIELEYMLVDQESLEVRPVADEVLARLSSIATAKANRADPSPVVIGDCSDVSLGNITWSNELAAHVIELKVSEPTANLRELSSNFESAIKDLRPILRSSGIRLLPTGMHPWMNPKTQTVLWQHENQAIYQAFDRVFNCETHGWSNVQSVHLNLPFANENEFARLHAAVRLVLPILPALSASSPVVDGALTGSLDSRLLHYAAHCHAVPSLTGNLIPEAVFDEATYRREIFSSIEHDIRPHDQAGVFDVEFLNARGAIARFDRGSIEIRVMDVQEYPGADVAICAAVIALLKELVSEKHSSFLTQKSHTTAQLRQSFDRVCVDAENAMIDDAMYLHALGIESSASTAGDVWKTLLSRLRHSDNVVAGLFAPLEIIQQHGTLATRIARALGPAFTREDLQDVYHQLADCVEVWEPFQP